MYVCSNKNNKKSWFLEKLFLPKPQLSNDMFRV